LQGFIKLSFTSTQIYTNFAIAFKYKKFTPHEKTADPTQSGGANQRDKEQTLRGKELLKEAEEANRSQCQ